MPWTTIETTTAESTSATSFAASARGEAVVHRVDEVEERADAADAEPADQRALRLARSSSRQSDRDGDRPDDEQQQGDEPPRGEVPLDRPQQHADRDHRDDLADALDLLVEARAPRAP